MTPRRLVAFAMLAVVVGVILVGIARVTEAWMDGRREQAALQPFYTPPDPLPGGPGTVIRTEPMDIAVPGGTALRILYVSERADGTPAASSGMILIPDLPAPETKRPVVAWEHGTLGMGDACVPSRSTDPLADMMTFVGPMMEQGWVIVATDYVGLGTPGPNQYLVAQSEVRDVVNAVRAARAIPEAEAGDRYVTFGHSQGGHSSVWTGHLGAEYAPELQLLGVAAAAPALKLPQIATAQWDTPVGWVIGSDLIESWPTYFPDLPVDEILTTAGRDATQRLSAECIKAAGLEAFVREKLGQQFFSMDPATVPSWSNALDDQEPPPLPASMPAFIAQGTADDVVLAWPNAMIQQEWCAAGSNLTVLWMGGVNHMQAANVSGPAATQWIADRFAGVPAVPNCDFPTPIPAGPPAS